MLSTLSLKDTIMTNTATQTALRKAGPCTLSVQLVDKDSKRRVFVQSFTATCIKYTSSARFAYKFNSAKDCEQSWVHRFHAADAPEVELAMSANKGGAQ